MRDRWDLLVVFCFNFCLICFFRFFLFFFGMHLLDTPLAYSRQGVHVHSHRVFSDYCASGCHETCDDLTLFLRLTGLYLMYIRISLIVTLSHVLQTAWIRLSKVHQHPYSIREQVGA